MECILNEAEDQRIIFESEMVNVLNFTAGCKKISELSEPRRELVRHALQIRPKDWSNSKSDLIDSIRNFFKSKLGRQFELNSVGADPLCTHEVMIANKSYNKSLGQFATT